MTILKCSESVFDSTYNALCEPTWIKVERKVSAFEKRTAMAHRFKMSDAEAIAKLTSHRLEREDVEVMLVVCLDGRNNVKHIAFLRNAERTQMGL